MKTAKQYTSILVESLIKRESPISARMRRRFQQEAGLGASKRKKLKDLAIGPMTQKFETRTDFETPLAKNEYQMTSYMNGALKMEFGPEVPEKVRERARNWASKRGLKVAEVSLEKNSDGFERILFAPKS